MKTLLIIHVICILLALMKFKLIYLRIKREGCYIKSDKSFKEKVIGYIYHSILICIPPIAFLMLFITEEKIMYGLKDVLVKKDA